MAAMHRRRLTGIRHRGPQVVPTARRSTARLEGATIVEQDR
jgi:hypothetical protein